MNEPNWKLIKQLKKDKKEDHNKAPLILLLESIFSFNGRTEEFFWWNVIIISINLLTSGSLYYYEFSSEIVANITIALISLALVPIYILVSMARLKFLNISYWLLIFMFLPIVNFIFIIVLCFLKPAQKKEMIKSKSDLELEELRKKVEIAELKKKLQDLEK